MVLGGEAGCGECGGAGLEFGGRDEAVADRAVGTDEEDGGGTRGAEHGGGLAGLRPLVAVEVVDRAFDHALGWDGMA